MRPDHLMIFYTASGTVLGLLIGFFVASWLAFSFTEGAAFTVVCTLCGGLIGFRLWQGR